MKIFRWRRRGKSFPLANSLKWALCFLNSPSNSKLTIHLFLEYFNVYNKWFMCKSLVSCALIIWLKNSKLLPLSSFNDESYVHGYIFFYFWAINSYYPSVYIYLYCTFFFWYFWMLYRTVIIIVKFYICYSYVCVVLSCV